MTARTQTKGRGRGENIWYSAPGGLYISIVLRLNLNREASLPLSLVVANSVAKAIEKVVNVKIETKWINDLMVDGYKIGGVLVETEGETEPPDFFIAGIGVNVNQASFPANDFITSLALITSHKISRWQLLQSINCELQNDCALFQKHRFLPFREEYKSRCAILNKEVLVTVGKERIAGRVIDIDEDGRLVLSALGGQVSPLGGPNQKIVKLISGTLTN